MPNPIYTVSEAAAYLKVSAGWIRDHATGRYYPTLHGSKMGKFWRFTESQLQEFEQHCAALGDQIAKRKASKNKTTAAKKLAPNGGVNG